MKATNLCDGRGGCCPRLVMEKTSKELKFHIIDGDVKIVLESEIARNFALTVLKEINKCK